MFLLVHAVLQVPSSYVGTAESLLARQAMQKLAFEEMTGLAVGFAVGQASGAIANFIDKVFCGGLTQKQVLPKALSQVYPDIYLHKLMGL